MLLQLINKDKGDKMLQNDKGQSDVIGIIVGTFMAIIVVILLFFFVLPEFTKAIGSSFFPASVIGFILLATIIAAAILSLLKRG